MAGQCSSLRSSQGLGFRLVHLLWLKSSARADERARTLAMRRWITIAVLVPAVLELSSVPISRVFAWGEIYEAATGMLASLALVVLATLFIRWSARVISPATVLLFTAIGCLILETTIRAISGVDAMPGWALFRADSAIQEDVLYLLELGTLLALFLGLFIALTDERLATLALADHGDRVVAGLQRQIDADKALRGLVEATAEATGDEFFDRLAESLADMLGVDAVFISRYMPEQEGKELQTLALWDEARLAAAEPSPIEGTPCRVVLERAELVFIAEGACRTYADDEWIVEKKIESYLGLPMFSRAGVVLGHIAVMSASPMTADIQRERVLRLFADRAGVELERMQQEARLRDQAKVIESAQDSVITIDLEGKIVAWNRGAEQLFGYSREECIGESLAILFSDESAFQEAFHDGLRGGQMAQNSRTLRRCKDGTDVDISLSTFPLHDTNGNITAFCGIARDITKQVEQERALRESESRLRMFFANVPDIITVMNLDGTITYTNRGNGSLTPDEYIGRNARQFVPEEFLSAAEALLGYVIESKSVQTFEVPSALTGKIYRVSIVPILVDKRVSELLLISRDVTDRIEQEKALRESEATLRGLFENVPDLIRVLAPDGTIKFANHTYWDSTPEELVGRNILDFVVPERREESRAWFERVVRTGESSTAEQRGMRTDKTLMTRLVPILDETGVVEEVLMVATDITEQRAQQDALRETRDEFQFLAEHMNDIIWRTDATMQVQYTSPSFERITGYSVEEAIEKGLLFNAVPEDMPRIAELIQSAMAGEIDEAVFEFRANRKDGSEISYEVNAVTRRDDSGALLGMQGVARDITERRRAEQALRAREAMQRVAFENVPDQLSVVQPDGTILFTNHAYAGFTSDELVGRNLLDFLRDEDRDLAIEILRRTTEEQVPQSREWLTKDGGRYLQVLSVPIRSGPGGTVEEILTVATDVTEQRTHEVALRDAKDQYQFLAERMNDVVWQLDRDFRFIFVSPSVERVTGYSVEECLGRRWTFNVPDEHSESVMQVVQDALDNRRDEAVFDLPSLTKDGEQIIYEVSMVALRDSDSRFSGLQGIARDITERRRAENALREREALYRVIVETSHEGICMVSQDYRVVFVNSRMAEMMKYTPNEIVGREIADFVVEKYLMHGTDLLRRLRKESALMFEFPFRAKDGSVVWTDVAASQVRGDDGALRGAIGMVTDISERKRAEEEKRELEVQVQHAQKLESLGVLAGGIAHDFNNLLAGIMGYASLLAQDLSVDDARLGYVQKIEMASNRAAELTKQMLAYSGKGKFVLEQLDLTRLTNEMLNLIHASISKRAETVFALGDDLPPVRGDSAQISQVIMNLVINASDALEDRPGKIVVRTRVVDATEALLRRSVVHTDDVKPGQYVAFETVDNGCGMDPETLKRIFDPFFTTKFTGRGLGLAAALGIVRGHHGALIVDSAPGKGTTMQVLFPVSSSPAYLSEPKKLAARHRPELSGTVLIADDDPMVLSLATDILERHGMDVIQAPDGKVALERFRANPMGFRVVLLDLTMPKLNGRDAFRAMRELRSDVPVIISSGYAEREALEQIGEHSALGFIQKPYRTVELIEKFKNVLEGATIHVAK